jgi:hypothetical protein
LAKDFHITEELRFQLKADAFNLLNNMSWGDPITEVDDGNFGQSTNQAGFNLRTPHAIGHAIGILRSIL